MQPFTPTERTTVRRLPKRAAYDRETVYSILDEAFVCHVAFNMDGRPAMIPTGFARHGDQLYLHGSAASRMLRTLEKSVDVCVAVTLIDGLVLARSAFHHSMNYRSVVIFGKAAPVVGNEAKMQALRILSEHLAPGRWDVVRVPNEQELKATSVLVLPLEEVSAKVRTGGPIDDEDDLALPAWAGVLPLRLQAGEPVADAHTPPATPPYPTPARFERR